MQKLLGVVVIYHPKSNVVQNILTYLPKLHTLLLIDNSEPSAKKVFEQLLIDFKDKIEYLPNLQNEGIAKPLNQAAEYGVKNNFDWLLTMDQDSFFHSEHLDRLIDFTVQNDTSRLGIVAPFHHTPKATLPILKEPFSEVRMTMTSGNLLHLAAFKRCGAFNEALFIDSVDHEYCLRLRKKGFKIMRVNDAILDHQLGEIIYKKFLFLKVKLTNHSAQRRYYIARNRLYVMFKYVFFDFKFFRRELKQYFIDFLKVIFFESGKTKKIWKIVLGTFHFLIGVTGKEQDRKIKKD
jgi:rhamnosyltransferase